MNALRDPDSDPVCRFFTEFRISLGRPVACGESSKGERRIVPILGGTFEGPDFSGVIEPGGSDWQMVLKDGVMELDARYVLRTMQDESVAVHNGPSYRYGDPDAIRALLTGRPADPSSYYTCGIPQFDTGAPRIRWINYHRFVSKSSRTPDSTVIRVFRVD